MSALPATAQSPAAAGAAGSRGLAPVRVALGAGLAGREPASPEGRMRFAAYVAHELRTPLATQRALLELALADPDANAASWREVGEDVLRACLWQERLLEACLTLARTEAAPERREPVDLAEIAAEALQAQDAGGLERVVALEPAWTSGDPGLLERLVANLVSNAIRHNVVGGRIEVATGLGPGCARLIVANTGPVVPAAEVQRLFQPFERLDSGPRACTDGVGLGLAIVGAIAQGHDAALTAQARAGGGLRIGVSFRAMPPVSKRARNPSRVPTDAPGR